MRKKKNNQEPKKSKMITGYIIYASEIRKEIIQANPDKDFGDISKIVGTEWKKLGQEQKVMFEKRAEEQNSLFKAEFAKMTEVALANQAIANANAAAAAAAAAANGVAPELDKLANVAAERAANEETQQQQQAQQDSYMCKQEQDGSFVTNQDSGYISSNSEQQHQSTFMQSGQDQQQQHQQQHQGQHQQQSQLRSPQLPTMSQYANNLTNYNVSYSQQSAYYQSLMSQSSPIGMRPSYGGIAVGGPIPSDLLLQQQQQQQPPATTSQQPFAIVQHPQPTTTVQYCNNPACCASGRYQPYPYPYSPPEPPLTPSSLQQQQLQHQQQVQSPPIRLSPTHQIIGPQQHLYKMNKIIYRKPSQVKLRPKDVGTQTDPIVWANGLDKESPKKQQLRFSKEFIKHLADLRGSRDTIKGPNNKITAECHW